MDKKVAVKGTLGDSGSKQPDTAGLTYGLSSLSGFDSSEGGLKEGHTTSKSGNYAGRPETNPSVTTASSKGKSFTIC